MNQTVPFFKMQGSGNDFILLNNDDLHIDVPSMPDWAKRLCPRAFGIGADGLIFLESAPDDPAIDYRWHFYNADGSRAEMCGNGSRCATRLAVALGLAPARNILGTDAGPVRAEVDPGSSAVKVQLTRPQEMRLNLELHLDSGQKLTLHAINTGVPHSVFFCPDPAACDLEALGPAIRYHQHFAPEGTNVNLVRVRDDGSLEIRTYERGVEAETLACGTGAAAAAAIANALGYCKQTVSVLTRGQERLTISLEPDGLFLQGAALLVFTGTVYLESVGLSLDKTGS